MRLTEEENRVQLYLHESTHKPVCKYCRPTTKYVAKSLWFIFKADIQVRNRSSEKPHRSSLGWFPGSHRSGQTRWWIACRLIERNKYSKMAASSFIDLHRMYSLLARIPEGLDPLRERFEAHVKKVGLGAIERIAQQETVVGLWIVYTSQRSSDMCASLGT